MVALFPRTASSEQRVWQRGRIRASKGSALPDQGEGRAESPCKMETSESGQSKEPKPELQELVDAEISVEGLTSPVKEEQLRQAVAAIPGVSDANLYGGMLALQYDPISTSKNKICEILVQAGFAVSLLRAAPASPLTDAIRP